MSATSLTSCASVSSTVYDSKVIDSDMEVASHYLLSSTERVLSTLPSHMLRSFTTSRDDNEVGKTTRLTDDNDSILVYINTRADCMMRLCNPKCMIVYRKTTAVTSAAERLLIRFQ